MSSKVKSRTFLMCIIWLILIPVSIVIQVILAKSGAGINLPIVQLVTFAGIICDAFIGLDKGTGIIKAARAPQGNDGNGGVAESKMKSRTFWIATVWMVYGLAAMICQTFIKSVTLPVGEIITFAGTVCAIYVGGNKGKNLAIESGTKE